MKLNFKISILAILAIAFVSCESGVEPEAAYKTITLGATLQESVDATKTTIVQGEKKLEVLWEQGDEILVVDEHGWTGKLKATRSGESTVFSGDVPVNFGKIQYAFYPADKYENLVYSSKTVTVTLEDNAKSTDLIGYTKNPSCAFVNGQDNAFFENICGILKLVLISFDPESIYYKRDVPGQFSLKLSTMADDSGVKEALSGKYTLNFDHSSDNYLGLSPVSGKTNDFQKLYVTMRKWAEPTAFYFILPNGALSNGFTLMAKDEYFGFQGGLRTSSTKTVIERGITKSLPPLHWYFDPAQGHGAEGLIVFQLENN